MVDCKPSSDIVMLARVLEAGLHCLSLEPSCSTLLGLFSYSFSSTTRLSSAFCTCSSATILSAFSCCDEDINKTMGIDQEACTHSHVLAKLVFIQKVLRSPHFTSKHRKRFENGISVPICRPVISGHRHWWEGTKLIYRKKSD